MTSPKLKYDHLKKISGWLGYVDIEIIKALLGQQNDSAIADCGIVEIGVHHGKSFVALAAFSGNANL